MMANAAADRGVDKEPLSVAALRRRRPARGRGSLGVTSRDAARLRSLRAAPF